MSGSMTGLIISAFWQTLEMVVISALIAVAVGLPLGVLLFTTKKGNLLEKPVLYQFLSAIVNAMRSVPFIILMVAIIPFTRFVGGCRLERSRRLFR